MGAVLNTRPILIINNTVMAQPIIWDWLTTPGYTPMIGISEPGPAPSPVYGDMPDNPTPMVWARKFDPRTEQIGTETVWVWMQSDAHPWGTRYGNGPGAYDNLYGAGAETVLPLPVGDRDGFQALRVSGGQISPAGEMFVGTADFWRDYIKGAVAVVAVATTVGYAAGAVGAAGSGVSGGSVLATETAVATAGEAAAMTAAEEWAIATAGMDTGMSVGTVASTSSGAVLTSAVEGVKDFAVALPGRISAVAKGVVQTAAAITTIKTTLNDGSSSGAPDTDQDSKPMDATMLFLVAGVVLILLVTK